MFALFLSPVANPAAVNKYFYISPQSGS